MKVVYFIGIQRNIQLRNSNVLRIVNIPQQSIEMVS